MGHHPPHPTTFRVPEYMVQKFRYYPGIPLSVLKVSKVSEGIPTCKMFK